jgi:flagellar protein FliS
MDIRRSYREAAVRGARPVELVARLYEQMIDDLRHAANAVEKNDIELRTNRINHAILVIGYLQSQLDFVDGGQVSQDLNYFYDTLRQNLVQVQFHPSKSGLAQEITDLLAVREAWIEVERAEKAAATGASTVPPAVSAPELEQARVEWKG